MGPLIFDKKTRFDVTPSKYLEGSYNFYDRSGWEASDNVRNLLNKWVKSYPGTERAELCARFKIEFIEAFFELFVYTFFSSLGFKLEPHPVLSHTLKKCDFHVVGTFGNFYLECIATSGLSANDQARLNGENFFYDFINQMDCPNFYLKLVDIGFKGTAYPPFKKIRDYLEQQINIIDPDSIPASVIKEFRDLPGLIHDDPKFYLKLQLIPKPKEARGKKARAIGVFTTKIHIGGFGYVLSDAIKRKAAKYGRMPGPFVIAINAMTELPVDSYDIEDALFSSLPTNRIPLILKNEYIIPTTIESSFFAFGKPVHTRVSAVLVTNVHPTNLGNAKYWIYYHPMAAKELDISSLGLNSYRITKDGVFIIEGKSIKDVLDIPDEWPGEKKLF